MGKKIKTRKVVEECLAKGITSPSLIREELAKRGKKVSDNAVTMAITRLGINRKAIAETVRLERSKDILEHQRVKDYLAVSETAGTTKNQQDSQIKHLRQMWEWMGCSAPEGWNYQGLIDCLKQHYAFGVDERGRTKFEKPSAVGEYLSAVATIFPNVVPKGYSAGFTREAGELKDYFTFQEFIEFVNALEDTPEMSLLGWRALFKSQCNLGCREGSRENTGITAFSWDNINYKTRRCSMREKGGKGKAARLWKNLPLDLFPFIHGWDDLVSFHIQQFGYEPTNEHHASGRVFAKIDYDNLREQFHAARKACNGRISGDKETFVPHIIRKTHAQWLIKLRVPLERICGQFPDGRYGVGWDNPLILLRYYVTLESDEEQEIEQKMSRRMEILGLASPARTEPTPIENTPLIMAK